MATGGYNASFDQTPTGFGSDSVAGEEAQVAGNGKGGLDSAPLVGIDYKRWEARKCLEECYSNNLLANTLQWEDIIFGDSHTTEPNFVGYILNQYVGSLF